MCAVYWITGLSGAGKTTIGKILYAKLKEKYPNTVFLDGDSLRQVFGNDLDYSEEDRRKCAMRYSRLCDLLQSQGMNVICCTISMFDSVREWNRENIKNYREIYIKTSLLTLQERDQKGLYSRYQVGEEKELAGFQVGMEEPKNPDLILENDGGRILEEQAEAIMRFFGESVNRKMKVVIMAGGRGTRIARLHSEIPKPMIPIEGMPILERQLQVLREQGFTDIILTIGYLGEEIRRYFGDGDRISPVTGESFGVYIQYVEEMEPLGTAGALAYMKDILDEDFLLINGDIVFDVDVLRFMDYHKGKAGLATIFTHPNDHPYDSGIICTDNGNRVTHWLHKEEPRQWYRNRVNAGLHILSPKILDLPVFQTPHKVDLDRDVLKPLIAEGQLMAYDSPEYVKDMGTPERYYEVAEDIRAGKVAAKNLSRKQKAVFLDRDGTLNKYVGFLGKTEDLELLDGAAEAVKRINRSGYLAIAVTNQPVIARGEVTVEELDAIHQKLETLLGAEGAYLDAIYYCPHHPDRGFEGEIAELKIPCACRKPNPGMLLKAAEDYNIDLGQSWMIGDSISDIQAGERAGCKTALLTDMQGHQGEFNSLLEAVKEKIR